MNETLYEVKQTSQFKKDYRLAKRRGQNIILLVDVVTLLANGRELPLNNRDHALSGDCLNFRECHIAPDWLLVYKLVATYIPLKNFFPPCRGFAVEA